MLPTLDDGNGTVVLLPPAVLPPVLTPVGLDPAIATRMQADEAAYLARYPDVAAAIGRGEFVSGWAHFDRYGRSEGRTWGVVAPPPAPAPAPGSAPVPDPGLDPAIAARMQADEAAYLARYPDVAAAVARGTFSSGRDHFDRYGRAEGRIWGVVAATADTGAAGAADGSTDTSGVLGDERTLESAYKPPGVVSQWRNLVDVFKLDVPRQHNAVRLANEAILQVFK